MTLQHVNTKIFVDGELPVDLQRFIDVFHRWIAEQSADETLIDVADYRHVPQGPGVVLVGHEADYAIDQRGGEVGLLYNRKAPLEGSDEDRLRQAIRAAAQACLRLEKEFDGLKFSRRRFEFFVNDRGLAPNTEETRAACEPLLVAALKALPAEGEFSIEFETQPRRRLGAVVSFTGDVDWAAVAAS